MLDNTSDYKSIVCYAILILIIILLQKKNLIGLTFSWSFTSYSLGGGEVFGLPFARLFLPLLYLVTFYLISAPSNPKINKTSPSFFNLLLIVILVKILLDSLVYGIDEFRQESLIIGFHVIVLSLFIFNKNIEINGYRRTVKDFVVTGLLIHGIISVILFYPIWQNQLIPALGFGHRITIFKQDTINSAKPFFFFIIFLISAINLKIIKSNYTNYLLIIPAIFCVIIIFLNGTRQYLVAILFIYILPLIKFNLKSILILCFLIPFLQGFLNVVFEKYSDLSGVGRLSSEELYYEKENGRIIIWEKGLNSMLSKNPALGLGFRNYGELTGTFDPNSDRIVIRKDNAHGFFQEVFIEHGIIIGILLLISFIYTLLKFRIYLSSELPTYNAIMVVLLAFFITSLFSGSILNGFGYFLFAIFTYHAPKLVAIK